MRGKFPTREQKQPRDRADVQRELRVNELTKKCIVETELTPAALLKIKEVHGIDKFRAALAAERTGWVSASSTLIKAKGANRSIIGARIRFITRDDDGAQHEMYKQIIVKPDGDVIRTQSLGEYTEAPVTTEVPLPEERWHQTTS